MVPTNHSAIVQWCRKELCTIFGPLGGLHCWQEFLSSFHFMIEYTSGPEDHVGDTLSRWAYQAGTAQDTNFNVTDRDLVGWQEDEGTERNYIHNELKKTYQEAFTAIRAVNWGDATTVQANLRQIRQAKKEKRKMSLINALIVLMKSSTFWC